MVPFREFRVFRVFRGYFILTFVIGCRNIRDAILHLSTEVEVITIAQWKITILGIYLCLGVVFAPIFLAFGLPRIDVAARGAGIGFKLLIFPGVVAFWPYLLSRWLRGEVAPRREKNAHRRRAQEGAR